MRFFLFATASAVLAIEEADHADVEEYLSLLQLSARPRAVAENSDDLDAHDVDHLGSAGIGSYPITWDTRRSFGPDGTWATPFCKNIQGCTLEERVCPAGCDGTAYWERTPYGNTRFGIPNSWAQRTTAHYIGCIQGMNRGGAFGSFQVHNHMQNCNNGPDSKKPAFFSKDPAWVPQNIGNLNFRQDPSQVAYGAEWCPADCVNDCAMFKDGHYYACGMTDPSRTWAGYDGKANARDAGPNAMCKIGVVRLFGSLGYTWCGEPTTTTTTPPPPPVEEPVDEPAADSAEATGDPHMTSNTGRHFDLE